MQIQPDETAVKAIMNAVVNIISGAGATASQFERLARELQIAEGPSTIFFLTGMRRILRELPDKAFADRNIRLSVIDAVQDALDAAIEQEEESDGYDDREET